MNHRRTTWKLSLRTLVLGTVLALMAASSTARAQTITMGVVDEDKLAEGYTKYKTAVDGLDKRAKDLDQQLAARELLNETEGKRFDELISKDTRSDAENTELTNIVKAGNDRRANYIELVGKATRTDAEVAQVKSMQEDAQRNAAGLQRVSDQLYNKVKQDQEAIDKQFTDQANTVIQQVAQDKKLTLVVRKRAVIWNAPSIDITDEVLTRLNKS